MNKAKRIKGVERLVKTILKQDERTRNSDSFLYFEVLKRIGAENGIDIEGMSITSFLLTLSNSPFPPFESVRRARQKLQNKFPELSANSVVEAYRAENEVVYREYARSGA